MIEAKVVADSVAPNGRRLTTFLVRMPRIILAEWGRHRILSFNSASSRARPTRKMIRQVLDDPFVPEKWYRNGKGMSSRVELGPARSWLARQLWLKARYLGVAMAWTLHRLGVHKQHANRPLELWDQVWILGSATSWGNLFNLRSEANAQPEFRGVVRAMLLAYRGSVPVPLAAGEYHVPFGDRMPDGVDLETRLKVGVARNARLSYETFAGEISVPDDVRLHDQLVADGHFSPAEQVARAESEDVSSGNFRGYTQYRKMLPGEHREDFDVDALLEALG